MEKPVSSGLKVVFLVHAILGVVSGLALLLIPDLWGSTVGWSIKEPTLVRLIGAAAIGLAVGSWLAYKATTWESVRILVQVEIIVGALGALTVLWGLLFEGFPAFGWSSLVVFAGFAIALGLFYSRQTSEERATTVA